METNTEVEECDRSGAPVVEFELGWNCERCAMACDCNCDAEPNQRTQRLNFNNAVQHLPVCVVELTLLGPPTRPTPTAGEFEDRSGTECTHPAHQSPPSRPA